MGRACPLAAPVGSSARLDDRHLGQKRLETLSRRLDLSLNCRRHLVAVRILPNQVHAVGQAPKQADRLWIEVHG